MKKILILLFSVLAFSQKTDTIAAKNYEIPQGTLIKAKLLKTITGGKAKVGEEVNFELAEPILNGDLILVHKGAKIKGFVTEARSSGIVGRKGKLAFTINYFYATDTNVVKLRSTQDKDTKNATLEVVAGSLFLTPVFLLLPGQGAKYEEGTIFDVYTDENLTIKK